MQKSNAEIDYMHPSGKPQSTDQRDASDFDGREVEAAAKRKRSALDEADGHHICSEECRRRQGSKVHRNLIP